MGACVLLAWLGLNGSPVILDGDGGVTKMNT